MRDETACRANVQMKRKRNTYLSKLNIGVKNNYTINQNEHINKYNTAHFTHGIKKISFPQLKLVNILTGNRGRYMRSRKRHMFSDKVIAVKKWCNFYGPLGT